MSKAQNTEDGRQKTEAEAPCILRQASVALVDAIMAGDLEATGRALDQRAQAIAHGAHPTEEVIALGEHACALLQDLKRRAGFDAARLRQIEKSIAPDSTQAHIEVHF